MREIRKILQSQKGPLVFDFDGTLTCTGSSMNSAVYVLGRDSEFARGRERLFQQYGWCRNAEEAQRDRAEEAALLWWRGQLTLYVSCSVSREVLHRTAQLLTPREEICRLLKQCAEEQRKIWIVSSGLTNVITEWLKIHEIPGEGIEILGNTLYYKRGCPIGYSNLITDWNKKDCFLEKYSPKEPGETPVFIGDRRRDLDWVEPGISFYIRKDGTIERTNT